MNSRVCSLLIMLTVLASLAAQPTNPSGKALFFVYDYPNRLPAPETNLNSIKALFQTEGISGDIVKNPSENEIIRKINDVASNLPEKSLIVIYLRGFGVFREKDMSNGIMKTWDSNVSKIDIIKTESIKTLVTNLKSKNKLKPVVIFDVIYDAGLDGLRAMNRAWEDDLVCTIYNHEPRGSLSPQHGQRFIGKLEEVIKAQTDAISFQEMFEDVSYKVSSSIRGPQILQKPYVQSGSGYLPLFMARYEINQTFVTTKVSDKAASDNSNPITIVNQIPATVSIPPSPPKSRWKTALTYAGWGGGGAFLIYGIIRIVDWIIPDPDPDKLPGPPPPPPQ